MDLISKQPYYIKIVEVIERLTQAGLLTRMQGNCVSSSDLVQNLLHQVGISSRIVEVQLTVTKQRGVNQMPDHLFIGYDNLSFNGQVDTHTVVITDTEQPLLLDLSIAHILEGQQRYVIHRLSNNADYLADLTMDTVQLTYQYKKNLKLPHIHQKNLLARILEEQTAKDTMRWLKWGVIA